MCLLILGWRVHPRFPLIVAANRDEFHERPAAPLGVWDDPPGLHAGRDLRAGGTWLGVDGAGRIGIVTNFRELQRPRRAAPSRGGLIPAWFASGIRPGEFLQQLEVDAPAYSGFNLLLGDATELWYGANRADVFARALAPGIYGLSNHFLDTPWPKLELTRSRFRALLAAGTPDAGSLFGLLADRTPAPEIPHPDSGLDPEWEHTLSSPFIVHPAYGTRCSTVVLGADDGVTIICERRFGAGGETLGETEFMLNG